jgi:uncharacterized membrane protein
MNRLCNFLTGATVGAGFLYYFDPVLGNRRRALVRDQINHAFNKAGDAIDATVRDLQNRTYGLYAEARGCLTSDHADDEIIAQRVRSRMGRHVSHPSSIEVAARNRVVHLSGPVLAHEVDDLVCAVKSVRGVEDVVDNLEVHESAEKLSALQGGVPRTGEPVDVMQANWSPTTRLLMGAAGTALMMRCVTRRTPAAALLCPAGFAMAMRAVTNLELGRAVGATGGRRGTTIQKTTTIHRPVEEVFEFLSEKSNYPRISDMITSVKELGDGRIQKTIAGPAGVELTVEERFTSFVPNEFLAVRSEPNSPIQYAMRVWFEPEGDSSTRVHIQATYNPPGGVLAHSAAWLAGMDIKSLFDDIMMRAKSYLESGRLPHDAARSEGQAQHHRGQHNGSRKKKAAKSSGESTGKSHPS